MISKKHDAFIKGYLSFILAVFMLFQISVSVLPVNGEEALYDGILRLHVLANSDSPEDQELKLYVRDVLLSKIGTLYEKNDVQTLDDAEKLIGDNFAMLTNECSLAMRECGFDYNVSLEISDEYYPSKEYENVSLPAGKYRSLRVLIGNAEGQNWWCVLFPSLCFSSAVKKENKTDAYVYSENGKEFIAAGFTPAQIRIITESEDDGVKLKFRTLELLGEIFAQKENKK